MHEITGILDIVDGKAHVRAEGYLPGPGDVQVPIGLVRKHGIRRGDTVAGRADERRLTEVDSVNGQPPRPRPDFADLVTVYPDERLKLETEQHELTTRALDLLMPVGKGQRALIVAPPKAGKTTVLQAIAHGIAKNHPECHQMLLLIGERPEEVTDFARSVPGEVIAATFDLPPRDHVAIAELAVERAKRLAEAGKDVVIVMDSLTRLGRAYNLSATNSGRILTGGIDSGALVHPKRLLGAARNIENGGSVTIFATALVETGSVGDSVMFEEYKSTGNAEVRLDRGLANKRVFPAIDPGQTGTRREDLLLTPHEQVATKIVRRALHDRDITVLLDKLRQTQTNDEFIHRLPR
ncbi:transcription termination factor Rho [Kibdelosporangium phytohabitans]|uniref:Transcription termination factor Rho n=1 Tax=Kibdelosporangium phytohabitans TaxID=860235 RepID=A0A0N9HXR5_9PSEU|nr:transcription termination factor Rho [Kibdelosporangium phytohabitans]MBE1468329.1 transcription termination factor Rho [Kibdelosporangium phytohabitans]